MESSIAVCETSWKPVNLLNDWERLQAAWDQFVDQHESGSIFHTSQMIRVFHAAKGHSVLPLAAVGRDGEILALLVAVRVQTLPDPFGRVSSRSILYAEPLCHDDPVSIEALTALVAIHDRFMRHRVLFTEVRPLFASGPERTALERCGYCYSDYLNYLIDLSQPLDALWTNMRKSARRGVRQCDRRGFHMREVDAPDGIGMLYRFLKLSYGNSRVPLADSSLFEAAFRELHSQGMMKLFATYDGDRPVAMDSLLNYKGRSLAWYGGLERLTGVSPFDYLQWYEIVWAAEQGAAIYDFGGAGWPDEPYGVREFKAKFGGELVCYGRYRKVYSPWKMALAERAYQFGRTVIAPK
ncbi:MAG: GNAT family N-acetyltransferase [Pirellulales bacterium]